MQLQKSTLKSKITGKVTGFLSVLQMDDDAQVSAELLIVIAALVAVALVLVTQLQNTAQKGKKVLSNATDKVFDEIADIK